MPKAKYEAIYRSIKKKIEAQDYAYQSLLPSENTLILQYGCSRNTVRRALADLIDDGYIQPIQGKGVRVIYQPVGKTTFIIGGIETFQETARRNRLHAVTRVVRFESVTADEAFAARSGFWPGDALWAVERVRYLDDKALILDVNYFLQDLVPGLTADIAARSIYEYIESVLGMQIVTSKRKMTVEHATTRDEELLDLDGYDCVAVVTNQTFNADGIMFEYTQSRHQPDYFCFQDIATRRK
ncbi:MAG TPA: trehalose operon repressor [Candidatus Gemmiger excrementavium]|uniref:Trehalose operon repressor n=1 Tax=Candidatus Gemmiger excrementavium TaxID=2838608 RepID=A0A9D2JEW1_9FIRM|nr:trehalose operon repressor [Candidatus Gemmiger excrementavium]